MTRRDIVRATALLMARARLLVPGSGIKWLEMLKELPEKFFGFSLA
jgi:hypothetical protein